MGWLRMILWRSSRSLSLSGDIYWSSIQPTNEGLSWFDESESHDGETDSECDNWYSAGAGNCR